eukprot:COSAG06_NODE_100_length_24132_cov_93.237507_5_plen_81_part_00
MWVAMGICQTFVASMTMALETGTFEYAHGVMHNWLQYYVRRNGTTTCVHADQSLKGTAARLLPHTEPVASLTLAWRDYYS